jgi:hypothetical protein
MAYRKKPMIVILVLLAAAAAGCSGYVSGSGLEFAEKTIIVKKGGDLQAALDKAVPGDSIVLEAGATFSGSFRLPNKSGNEFITVRSSAADAHLPAAGVRIDPAKHKAYLPKLVSDIKGQPVISAADGAHHFRFIAIEFGPTIEGMYDIIRIGTGQEKRVEELPHHIEFDCVWIHGSKTEGQRRGIAANGRHIRIINSYISDIKKKGDESQGIAAWATDGPIEITNNYIEGAAQSVLFGGAGSYLKLVPADCIVDSNHLNKPIEWKSEEWVVKNIFEIKNGRRIKVTNNLMTNNWAMGQDGNAILFTTRADNGSATIIEDIEFSGNIVRGTGGGLNILGTEGSGGHRLTVRNNIFDDIDGQKWGGGGHFMKVTQWDGLTIENNTIFQKNNIAVAYGEPVQGFVFRRNIVFENEYGFHGEEIGSGQRAIEKFFPGGTVTGNIIIGGHKDQYREPNLFPASIEQVGFEKVPGGYTFRPNSPYVKAVVDGKRIGADINEKTVGTKIP